MPTTLEACKPVQQAPSFAKRLALDGPELVDGLAVPYVDADQRTNPQQEAQSQTAVSGMRGRHQVSRPRRANSPKPTAAEAAAKLSPAAARPLSMEPQPMDATSPLERLSQDVARVSPPAAGDRHVRQARAPGAPAVFTALHDNRARQRELMSSDVPPSLSGSTSRMMSATTAATASAYGDSSPRTGPATQRSGSPSIASGVPARLPSRTLSPTAPSEAIGAPDQATISHFSKPHGGLSINFRTDSVSNAVADDGNRASRGSGSDGRYGRAGAGVQSEESHAYTYMSIYACAFRSQCAV